jgi:hypothetical protein
MLAGERAEQPEVVVEVDQTLQVERVVERRAGGMQLDEALERRQGLRLVAALVEHVGLFDLRLLCEGGARGAAFEAFIELAGVIVVAQRCLFLRL